MSTRQVFHSQLVCDGGTCEAVYPNIATPVSALREMAAKDGWRNRRELVDRSNWARSVDLCPACPDDVELKPLIPARQRGRR